MNKLILSAAILLSGISAVAQTCTLTGASPLNWPTDGTGIVCAGGGNAVGRSLIVIPSGMTVNFGNGDTWIGPKIEINGTVNITGNVTLSSSIVVNNGGSLSIPAKLALGTAEGCGYTLVVKAGGSVDTSNSASDRLTICGQDIIKGGGGGCNPNYPVGAPPYCDNGPGFSFVGPTAVDEDGYDATLPIKLKYFVVESRNDAAALSWATSMEENFYKFIIEHSANGLDFESIGEVAGRGFNIYDTETKYSFEDTAPLLGYNYYRLKAVDLDEAYEHFGVKAVKVNGPKKLATYPNPSKGDAISFRINFNPEESDRVVIIDQLGFEIFSGHASALQNGISFSDKLRPGVYMLRYLSNDFEQTTRVVVKN